ncbi:P-selectin-like [Schistocerca nitens]|uniref:P-selectin-like n=1 Tax=Schistocerca nitens TaxID=7011 RepID=UPI0021175BCD|nr:P-selectin-like [Schistocerca nitens]
MELKIIIVFAITIAGVLATPDDRRLVAVDRETYIYKGHKYTFHRERMTWEEAAQICSNEGGYLAILEDMAETQFITEAMAGGLCFFHPYQNIWIGGRYIEGNWMWVPTEVKIPSDIGSDGYPPWSVDISADNLCLTINRRFITRPILSDLNCEWKRNFVCERGCAQLKDGERQYWDPPLCSQTFSEIGDECSLICKDGYELSGSATITCTLDGWNGTAGLNKIPDCKSCALLKDGKGQYWDPPLCSQTHSEIGDECSLVCKDGYELSGSATVTCTADGWDGTDGLNNLPECKSCGLLKDSDRQYWDPPSCTETFKEVGDECNLVCRDGYTLNGTATVTCTDDGWSGAGGLNVFPECKGCAHLQDSEREYWDPPSCSQSYSEVGDQCSLICNDGYELSGSAIVTCTPDGWNGTGGFDKIPHCKTPEEIGEDFFHKINLTLNGVATNMLFLLDESGSVSRDQFDMEKFFVQSVAQSFPLSVNRTAGLITFSNVAAVDIPLLQTDTCVFVDSVGQLIYEGGGTSILVALNLAIDEIQQNAANGATLVFLITDGISTTDPTPAANTLKDNGEIVFTIGVASYDRSQLEPLASHDSEGVPNFFGVSSFEVFMKIAEYLNTTYINQNQIDCN